MFIELHTSFRGNRKIKRLATALNVSRVTCRGHLVTLWLAVLEQAPDGFLEDWDATDVAENAEWDGDPKIFVDALVANRLLDEEEGVFTIHDWSDYSQFLKAAKKTTQNRERKRAQRAREKEEKEKLLR